MKFIKYLWNNIILVLLLGAVLIGMGIGIIYAFEDWIKDFVRDILR